MIVVGVDPGSRETGLILRSNDDLLDFHVAVRGDRRKLPSGGYLRDVVGRVRKWEVEHGVEVIGVETVAWWPATGKGGPPRNQHGLYGTAMVLGAVLLRWPDAVEVEPGKGHGGLHRQAYPVQIRGTDAGADRLRHCRSAWDVSFGAEHIHRRNTMTRSTT